MELISDPRDGAGLDATSTMYPSRLVVVMGTRALESATSTYYGYVVSGGGRLRAGALEMRLHAGAFFAVPGPADLEVDGRVAVIERLGFRGLPTAGAIEDIGRLAYIDGCSDTVLVAPPRLGDPVFNFLHFPPGIEQSVHSHPSIRLGVVARGEGLAFGPAPAGMRGAPERQWTERLEPGAVFLLHAHEMHAFRTTESKRSLDVIAFHPDSDWGPTDGVHPMLNRTYRREPT